MRTLALRSSLSIGHGTHEALMAAGIGGGGECDPFSSKQGFLMPNLGSGGVMSTSHALPSPGCVASLSVGHSFLSSQVEAHQGEPTEFSGERNMTFCFSY